MTGLTAFTYESLAVQIHVLAALIALGITPYVLWRRLRDRKHKISGYIWCAALLTVALSSFVISNFPILGPFSPLHLLSVMTIITVTQSIRWAIAGNIEAHKTALRNLATYGLGIPMALNFLPDRLLTRMFFAENFLIGLIGSASLTALIILWRLHVRGKLWQRVSHAQS